MLGIKHWLSTRRPTGLLMSISPMLAGMASTFLSTSSQCNMHAQKQVLDTGGYAHMPNVMTMLE